MEYLQRGLEQPHRAALIDDAGCWTYEQLAWQTRGVATQLSRQPRFARGDRIGLFLPCRKESVPLLLGIFGSGGVAVPFSVRATAREIAHQLSDAGISYIIEDIAFRDVLKEAVGRVASSGRAPTLIPAAALLESPHAASDGDLSKASRDDEAAIIIYTSGTTGAPKGVVHTRGSLLAQVDVLARAWEWTADDRLLHVLPLHHVHGLVNGLLGALRAGAVQQFLDGFTPLDVWRHFVDASVFYAVPTIYHQLTDAWERQDAATQHQWTNHAGRLRLTVSGSAALPARLWHRWLEITGQTLLERYGMTEIGMAVSNPYRGERRPGTVGQPLPGIQVKLVTDDGHESAAGTPGEIRVQGPTLFREYWNQPEATRESFRDGFFRTGDVGEYQNGYLRVCGRASVDILKSAGYKLSALEIEEVLREHPAVREVAVIGIPDDQWGEVVAACVVVRPGASLTLEQVRAWCQDKLAPYKAPRRLVVRADLPRNAMGKVTKPDLIRELTNS